MTLEEIRAKFGIKEPTPKEDKTKGVKRANKGKEMRPDGILPANGQTKKYGNKKEVIDGIVFDSLKEGQEYQMLKVRKERGSIVDFQVHVKYVFILNGVKISSYTIDFVVEHIGGVKEYIDVKSFATKMKEGYKLRKKMMKAFFGIDVVEK